MILKASDIIPISESFGSSARALAGAGKTDEAGKLADEALARKTLRSDWARGELRALVATIRKDYSGRADALTDLAKSTPTDSSALAAAAEAQTMARNFAAAIDLYTKLRALNPNNAIANLLGLRRRVRRKYPTPPRRQDGRLCEAPRAGKNATIWWRPSS